jgi:hypothetical protein
MPVSKRRKKRQRRREKPPFGGLRFFEHPFSKIPRDALVKGLADAGRRHAEQFPKLLEEMQKTINGVDALQAIATLSTYGMMGGMTEAGERKPFLKGERFNQSHVELVQALALRTPEDQRSHHPSLPEIIQKLIDGLPELGDAFHYRRFVQIEAGRTEEEKSVLVLQEHLRAHTQAVRNWGYYHRVVRIIRDLVVPIDQVFLDAIGIPASALVSLFEKLIDDKEGRATERMEKLSKVITQPTVESAIRAYYEVNPQLKDSADDMIAIAKERNYSLDAIRSIFLSHSELSLAEEATFDVNEVAKQLSVDAEGLKRALNKLSLAFGDLANESAEHFFLTNPVWTRPLVKLSDSSYYCAIPVIFFSFAFPILEQLLEGDAGALKHYFDRRAEFLEQVVGRIFREAFPGSECVANYRWKEAAQEFESDFIVRIDSHLLLVEAKSGTVSWPALRGAPDRAKTHARQLLLAPSEQSLRFQHRIEQVLANPQLKDELLPNLGLDIAKVRQVLRLSVTLEDFAILQSNLHLLREAGWIPKDHPLAACIHLADLEIVVDVLELTPLKLHYIQRRAQLEARMNYLGDEMDLLGFYLQTGFNIGDAELGGPHFTLTMLSKPIDKYYMGIDDDIRVNKPQPRLTRWWRDLCMTLERRQFHQWSEMAVVLLNFSFSEQQRIEKSFKKIVKNVFKKWREHNHLSAITVIPAMHRSDALAVYAFRERYATERRERMQNIAAQVFQSNHVRRCMVIGINIDRKSYPYSTLAVFFPGNKESGAIEAEQAPVNIVDGSQDVS